MNHRTNDKSLLEVMMTYTSLKHHMYTPNLIYDYLQARCNSCSVYLKARLNNIFLDWFMQRDVFLFHFVIGVSNECHNSHYALQLNIVYVPHAFVSNAIQTRSMQSILTVSHCDDTIPRAGHYNHYGPTQIKSFCIDWLRNFHAQISKLSGRTQ